ncbi:hypothetical protein [Undibacterium sp. TJN19]|uniref:hypothetical protein n=1 Tax=Undibacterium sp. TJN19 TaxID=3413055 RepID=UPI003BF4E73C
MLKQTFMAQPSQQEREISHLSLTAGIVLGKKLVAAKERFPKRKYLYVFQCVLAARFGKHT